MNNSEPAFLDRFLDKIKIVKPSNTVEHDDFGDFLERYKTPEKNKKNKTKV